MNYLASVVFLLVPLFCGAISHNDVNNFGVECKTDRGCTKDADDLEKDVHNFSNDEHLPIKPLKCISCDSKVDLRCTHRANEIEPQKCTSETACFVGQTAEGVVIRGCGHQSTEATQINTCYSDGCNNKALPPPKSYSCVGSNCNDNEEKPCKGDNCNNDSKKSSLVGAQKHCYQCKDSTNCRNTPDRSLLKPCASPSDGCMQYINIMHEMVRGCKFDKEYDECLKKGKECLQCTQDGCNNVEATKTAELSCLLCDSSDANCFYTINKNVSMKCHPKVPFYSDSFGCYSCLSKDKKTATRGCYWDEFDTSNDYSAFHTCTTDYCNDKSLFVQSCIQCTGDSASCNGGLSGTECKGTVYLHNLGCYAKKIGNIVKRGCISDLADPHVCQGDYKFCQFCLDQNCNTSGTAKFFTSLGVLLAPLLVSLYLTF